MVLKIYREWIHLQISSFFNGEEGLNFFIVMKNKSLLCRAITVFVIMFNLLKIGLTQSYGSYGEGDDYGDDIHKFI